MVGIAVEVDYLQTCQEAKNCRFVVQFACWHSSCTCRFGEKTMQQTIIGTWLHAETKGTESQYMQVGGVSSSTSFQDVYWRCVAVFFASSVRHNPDTAHRLFTTVARVPDVNGFSLSRFLERLGVEVVQVPLTYLPPPGYHGAWRNQFYILDIIKYLDAHAGPDEQFVILDSDCVFTASARPLSEDLSRHGLLAFDATLPVDEDINGITQRDMKRIFEELGQPCPGEAARYYGGEFFAATADVIHQLALEVDPLWKVQMTRFEAGQSKFNEEAHFLSYLYAKLGHAAPTANSYIARIWTSFKYRNTSPSDFRLTVWHVPAEKKYGIKRLYQQVIQPGSKFWTVPPGAEFARYAADYLGIPTRSFFKKSQDALDAAVWRLQSRVASAGKS